MPTYTAVCHACGGRHDFVRKIADRDDTPFCCEKATERVQVAPMVSAMVWTGHKGFMTSGNGRWIETGQDMKKYMRDTNSLTAEEGLREAEIQRKAKEVKQDKALHEAVVAAVEKHTA